MTVWVQRKEEGLKETKPKMNHRTGRLKISMDTFMLVCGLFSTIRLFFGQFSSVSNPDVSRHVSNDKKTSDYGHDHKKKKKKHKHKHKTHKHKHKRHKRKDKEDANENGEPSEKKSKIADELLELERRKAFLQEQLAEAARSSDQHSLEDDKLHGSKSEDYFKDKLKEKSRHDNARDRDRKHKSSDYREKPDRTKFKT